MAELRSDPMVMRTYPDPADAIEAYLRFIYLAAVMPGGAVPNKAVDAVWHAHLSHTRDYTGFCRDVVRRFIHHTPSPRAAAGPDAATRDRFRETQMRERAEFSPDSLASLDQGFSLAATIGTVLVAVVSALTFGTAVALITAQAATAIGLVILLGVALHVMTKPSQPRLQPAGHPDRRAQQRTAGGDGGSAGPEIYYLQGQPGTAAAEGCAPGSASAEACALDGGHSGGPDGNGDGDGDGSGGDGSGCSSCGGGD